MVSLVAAPSDLSSVNSWLSLLTFHFRIFGSDSFLEEAVIAEVRKRAILVELSLSNLL